MVTNENRIAPVYITSDVPFADQRDSELTKWINQTYQLVPQGLVFKLAARSDLSRFALTCSCRPEVSLTARCGSRKMTS